MNIIFYQFAKRNNSTKIVNTTGTTLTCQLKAETDMINPVLEINAVPVAWNPIWNYCYIAAFERYYFVNNWRWKNGIWECECSVDVLASWRTEIGGTTEYILRTNSTTTDFNGEITDLTYPATTDIVTNTTILSSVFTTSISNGVFIVGIINNDSSNKVGALSYYAMTPAEFGDLNNMLLSDFNLIKMDILDGQGVQIITDIPKEILKMMYNPFQYVSSCMWFPFTKDSIFGENVTTIKLGWWEYSGLTGKLLTQQIVNKSYETITLSDHPQAAARGSYLNYAPYTSRYIVGRFGTIILNPIWMKTGYSFGLSYDIDLIEGTCITNLERFPTGSGSHPIEILAQRPFQLGVPIQLAQIGTDYLGVTMTVNQGAVDMFNSTLSGLTSGGIPGAIVNGIGSTLDAIGNTIKSAMPIMETSGVNASFLSPYNDTCLVETFYKIVDEDITHRGRPLCEMRQINTLTGFVLCADGELEINATENEKKLIAQYLTTGFFWE